jgi:hypothetical protein
LYPRKNPKYILKWGLIGIIIRWIGEAKALLLSKKGFPEVPMHPAVGAQLMLNAAIL